MSENLENDLKSCGWIIDKCKNSKTYSQNLYATICNNDFFKNNEEWHCSWRGAGRIISELNEVGDYLDYYCSGLQADYNDKKIEGYVAEGVVKNEIREDLAKLGWIVKQNEEIA
jgi:hypothetical protein